MYVKVQRVQEMEVVQSTKTNYSYDFETINYYPDDCQCYGSFLATDQVYQGSKSIKVTSNPGNTRFGPTFITSVSQGDIVSAQVMMKYLSGARGGAFSHLVQGCKKVVSGSSVRLDLFY